MRVHGKHTHLFQMRGDPFNEIHGALFISTVAKELLRVDTLPRADERAQVCPDLLIIEHKDSRLIELLQPKLFAKQTAFAAGQSPLGPSHFFAAKGLNYGK